MKLLSPNMKSEKVQFKNKAGQILAARLDLPVEGKPRAFALFSHCFTCGKNLIAESNISTGLTQHGLAVLCFDFTGLGESEGDFGDTNFSSNVDDIIAASEFLSQTYEAPKILVGHSLGGTATLMAALKLNHVQAVATIGSPVDPAHVLRLFQERLGVIQEKGEAQVSIGGHPFTVKRQLVDDLENNFLEGAIKNLDAALLIMHTPQDSIVKIDNAARIYQAAYHPKSFISLDGADHLLSNSKDSLYAGQMIANWASRYVDLQAQDDLETSLQAVVRTGSDGLITEIKSGGHHLLADEPESSGGANLGPNPYDLLVASLGACKGMTLRMYADHKKWDLKEVRVHLQHQKVYVDDVSDPEKAKSKIDQIEVQLEVEGNLDQSQRERLLEISTRCPVHRTLIGDIRINSTLKEG